MLKLSTLKRFRFKLRHILNLKCAQPASDMAGPTDGRAVCASAFAALLGASVFAGPAAAEVMVAVPLHLGLDGNLSNIEYSCADGSKLTVQYINAKENGLALLPLKGNQVIFVNVISGSGARYVAGARTWWIKGDQATLSDETSKEKPLLCSVTGGKSKP